MKLSHKNQSCSNFMQLVHLLRFTGVSPKVGRHSLRIGFAISSSTSVEYSSAVDSSADSSAEPPINDSSVETSIVSSLFWIPEVEGKGWTSIDVAADGLSCCIEHSGLGGSAFEGSGFEGSVFEGSGFGVSGFCCSGFRGSRSGGSNANDSDVEGTTFGRAVSFLRHMSQM